MWQADALWLTQLSHKKIMHLSHTLFEPEIPNKRPGYLEPPCWRVHVEIQTEKETNTQEDPAIQLPIAWVLQGQVPEIQVSFQIIQ